jgi:oxygen-dependent protoporphyrinogen oxidase
VPKAIIVGAGLAGLTAGYRLKQAGWEVQVLEAAHEPGGRAVSVSKQGYLFDTGAVGLGTVYKDYMDLVAELGLSGIVEKSSTISATVRQGKIYEIDSARPITGLTSKLFSFGSKIKLINLIRDLGKVKPHLDIRDVAAAAQFDDENVEDYALRRLNKELLEYLVEPVARTVNLTRARNISKLELMNSLAGLFDTTLIGLRGGVAVFAEKLAANLDISFNTKVSGVKRYDDHVEVSFTDAHGTNSPETADACIIATTLPQAIALYPEAEKHYAPLAGMIHYNRGLCVHLGYKALARTKALIVMMPPSEQQEIAVVFMEHNKATDRAPVGHSMITVFFDDTTMDRPWALSDEALAKETSGIIEKYMPELAGQLEMWHVSRWPLGLTSPNQGIYKAMQAVNESDDPADRVQLTGDFRSTAGQNSAVAWGNNIARNLIKNLAA